MLWKLSDLETFSLRARDGVIGRVDELLVSDESWAARYLVVETGEWLRKRRVLVSPLALSVPNGPARVIPVDLTRAQIQKAPLIDAIRSISRGYQAKYHDHYGWPYYWVGGPLWGAFLTPQELALAEAHRPPPLENADEDPPSAPLRATRELAGYRFEARDGELGHVEDFIVDDDDWTVKYLEIDTRNWWPGGKRVLLARAWLEAVDGPEGVIRTTVTRKAVKEAPAYDDSHPISAEYEHELAKHYGLTLTAAGFR